MSSKPVFGVLRQLSFLPIIREPPFDFFGRGGKIFFGKKSGETGLPNKKISRNVYAKKKNQKD